MNARLLIRLGRLVSEAAPAAWVTANNDNHFDSPGSRTVESRALATGRGLPPASLAPADASPSVTGGLRGH